MPSSITRATALDHERMQRLLRRACTPGPSQHRWRDELVHLVRAHREGEEAALTDEVVIAAGAGAAEALDELRRADEAFYGLTTALGQADVSSKDLLGLGRQLRLLLVAHADLLAGRVLGPLEQALPRKEIRRLGATYAQCRDQALQGPGAAGTPRRLDLPRAELYELARRAGIDGRSSMSRGDLINELRRHREA